MIIGVGIDIVDINRIHQAIQKYGQHFLNRVFTASEQSYGFQKSSESIRKNVKESQSTRSFAKMFAAKEAGIKAIGDAKGISWHDFEVCHEPTGKPYLVISNQAEKNLQTIITLKKRSFIKNIGKTFENIYDDMNVQLSLSDDHHYAVASVILEII